MAVNITLKVAILQRGYTQTELARRANLTDFRLSRIVNGHRPDPTDDEKKVIARLLRRKVEELFAEVAA